jgi:hypothetical protein
LGAWKYNSVGFCAFRESFFEPRGGLVEVVAVELWEGEDTVQSRKGLIEGRYFFNFFFRKTGIDGIVHLQLVNR